MSKEDVLAKDGQSEDQAAIVEQLKADLAQKEADYKSLQSDYTVKTQKLSDLEKTVQPVKTETPGFDPSKLSDEDRETYNLVKKAGGVTQDLFEKQQAEIQTLKSMIESTNESIKNINNEKKLDSLNQQINALASQYDFVKPDELKNFMKERSDAGEILLPQTAMLALYQKQFMASGVKPDKLPAVDKSAGGSMEGVDNIKAYSSINDPEMQKDLIAAIEAASTNE